MPASSLTSSCMPACTKLLQCAGNDLRNGVGSSGLAARKGALQHLYATEALGHATQQFLQAAAAGVSKVELDPLAAKKAAEEAEERRLAELRAHGTPVNPSTFSAWKARFDAEMALARARHAGDAERRDAGLTGKAFFRQMDEARAVCLLLFAASAQDDTVDCQNFPPPLCKGFLLSILLAIKKEGGGPSMGGDAQAGQDLGDAEDGDYEAESEEEEEEEVELDEGKFFSHFLQKQCTHSMQLVSMSVPQLKRRRTCWTTTWIAPKSSTHPCSTGRPVCKLTLSAADKAARLPSEGLT